jgi:hypothetical protein
MRHAASALLALGVFSLVPAAWAQGQDGSFFLRTCGAAVKQSDGKELTDEESLGALFCASYISGFLDSMSLTATFTKGKRQVCTPERGVEVDPNP